MDALQKQLYREIGIESISQNAQRLQFLRLQFAPVAQNYIQLLHDRLVSLKFSVQIMVYRLKQSSGGVP